MDILPFNITANRKTRQLVIDWQDGHRSEYGFRFLRDVCPCAHCQGGHENMGKLPEAELYSLADEENENTRLMKVEAVGGYAITFEWEDGHYYGIYNWNYLRAICPCEICRSGSGSR